MPDWAGIVGDFLTASPDYLVTDLVPTTYGGYFGAGFNTGPCTGGGGSGYRLHDDANPCRQWALLADPWRGQGYDLQNPGNGVPTGVDLNPPSFANGNPFSATLTAVPEPSTWAMMVVGFAGLGMAGLRSLRSKPAAA